MNETLSGFCGKVIHVALLYEVGDKLLVDSLLPVWSNVMDSVMEKQLSAYLDQLNTWLLSKFCYSKLFFLRNRFKFLLNL